MLDMITPIRIQVELREVEIGRFHEEVMISKHLQIYIDHIVADYRQHGFYIHQVETHLHPSYDGSYSVKALVGKLPNFEIKIGGSFTQITGDLMK